MHKEDQLYKEYRENVYSAKKMEISNYTFPEEYCYLKAIVLTLRHFV